MNSRLPESQDPAPIPLRAQRMTADEAKSVIDLWQRERDAQTGLTDRPAVPDVAEGLDIGVEDVQRLLAEVRERRAGEERALAYEQELAEIRLAEEERKLAEVKRQRAELRREQAARPKPLPVARVAEKRSDLEWQIPTGVAVFLIFLWMAIGVMNSVTRLVAPNLLCHRVYGNGQPAPDEPCVSGESPKPWPANGTVSR